MTSCPSTTATAESLAPFAMWPAFPASDYYGASAPSPRHQPTADLPTTVLAGRGEGGTGTVPTFTTNRSTGAVPSFSPAASARVRRRLPRSHQTICHQTSGVGVSGNHGHTAHCFPAHIRQVGAGSVA